MLSEKSCELSHSQLYNCARGTPANSCRIQSWRIFSISLNHSMASIFSRFLWFTNISAISVLCPSVIFICNFICVCSVDGGNYLPHKIWTVVSEYNCVCFFVWQINIFVNICICIVRYKEKAGGRLPNETWTNVASLSESFYLQNNVKPAVIDNRSKGL